MLLIVFFEILNQLPVYHPWGKPLGASWALKTNNMIDFNNFSTTIAYLWYILIKYIILVYLIQFFTLLVYASMNFFILVQEHLTSLTMALRRIYSHLCIFNWLFHSLIIITHYCRWLTKYPGFEFQLKSRDPSCMPKEFTECLGKTCYFLDGYKHPSVANVMPIKDHVEAAMKLATEGLNES